MSFFALESSSAQSDAAGAADNTSRDTDTSSLLEGRSLPTNQPIEDNSQPAPVSIFEGAENTAENHYPEPTPEELAFCSQAEAQAAQSGRVLVITNISKLPNITQLILLAKANLFIPVLVNMKKTDTASLMDRSPGPFFRLKDITSLKQWLHANDVKLMLGIEIMETAKSVHDKGVFQARMALMPGNEGTGLSPAQKAACNGYIIIPQYGTATASLNVHVATCVVLYRYTCWLAGGGGSIEE